MAVLFLLLLIAAPLGELFVLLKVGAAIGAGPTVLAVIATAMLGAVLIRAQGRAALREAQIAMEAGEPPVAQAVHGVFLLIAGAFLLTPGFITDAIGFALLIPPLRLWLGRKILRAIRARMRDGRITIMVAGDRRR